MMQLDLHQPPGQQLGGGKDGTLVQHAHRNLPPLVGQLPGHGAQRHRGVGQVGREFPGRLARALLDAVLPRPGARVGGTVLSGPHAGQYVPHAVGVLCHMRENMRPGPARQQRRCSHVGVGQHPRRIEQALRRLVDLVAQLA